jgi:hypothetical protein
MAWPHHALKTDLLKQGSLPKTNRSNARLSPREDIQQSQSPKEVQPKMRFKRAAS